MISHNITFTITTTKHDTITISLIIETTFFTIKTIIAIIITPQIITIKISIKLLQLLKKVTTNIITTHSITITNITTRSNTKIIISTKL